MPAPAVQDVNDDADARWTGSVRTAVARLGDAPVPVTALVDAMLSLHADEYLRDWSTVPPTWPADLLRQTPNRWMAELDELVTGTRLFGRVAIVGWCLLDDRVAAEAERVGLLAGVASGVTPRLPDFLTPEGRRLLQRRAPLVALTVGEATPQVDVPTGPVTLAALARQPQAASRTVGRWAVSVGGNFVVGKGTRSQVEHSGFSGAEGPTSEAARRSAVFSLGPYPVPPMALGWWRGDVLRALTAGGTLLAFDARNDDWSAHFWPEPLSVTIGEDGIVASSAEAAGLIWSGHDEGSPVTLPVGPGPGSDLALVGRRIAALGDRLLLGGPDGDWTSGNLDDPGEAAVVAATSTHVVVAAPSGQVQVLGWDGRRMATGTPPVTAIQQAASSERLVALAGADEVSLLQGAAVVARWQAPSDEAVSAIALSPDSRALLVATQSTRSDAEPDGRVRIWRIDAVPEVRLTEYTADTPDGDDLLGVQPTVDALAAIISAVAVQPPLSVGLFGAWGSGKSFFMSRLSARVAQLTSEAHDSGRPQASLWAWRNVRQVQFNAWHYAAADVWAGILEHLVKELARPAKTGGLDLELPAELSAIEQRRVQELAGAVSRAEESDEALRAAQARLLAAQTLASQEELRLRTARTQAEQLRRDAPASAVKDQTRTQLNAALDAAGLAELGSTLDSTWREIEEARKSVRSASGLARATGRGTLGVALAVALVAGLVVTWILQARDVDLAGAAGVATTIVGCVAGIARWVRSAADQVHEQLAALDAAERVARQAQEEIEARARELQAEVESAERAVERAELGQRNAAAAVAKAKERVATSGPGDLLQEYLEGRRSADDYRGQLGLIGTVHRDLRVISDAVVANNGAISRDARRPLDDVVNRVVLYVDDLDRCPPAVVVKVLEAVSMLMTFPMFVVVVAVDAHWISKSLAAVYPELLTGRDVTPDNYLEKIFQLPVWLERPDDEAAAAMARTLLTGSPAPPSPSPEPTLSSEPESAREKLLDTDAEPRPEPTTEATGSATADVSLATTAPAAITLEEDEVAAIEALAPLIARSPRALKRYVNTYRVLKALIDADDLESARLLLGVATGRPDVGERLLADVLAAPREQTLGGIVQGWPDESRTWLAESVPPMKPVWSERECGPLKPVAAQVRRFVFHAQNPEDRQPDEAPAATRAKAPRDPQQSQGPTAEASGGDDQPSAGGS